MFIKNFKDIEKACEKGYLNKVHTSLCRQYVSRKIPDNELPIERYEGKYGKGYKVFSPNYRSSQYSFVTYYLENNGLKYKK